MEAARKTIEVLGQRILPERPHHLAFHPEWRYRPSHGDSNSFEEWHHPRLQYLTLLSEADRGVLLTKSDYDMREEPVKPLPREVNALAKGGEKKKLSLSDYKNKKTGATSSTSPPEPSIAKKKESERAGDLSASTGAVSDPKPTSESKSASEARKADRPRPRESDPLVDAKQRQAREPAADMRLPPKPPTKHPLPPRPPSPNSKKRVADLDDDLRPQKRSKADGSKHIDDRAPHSRDEAQKRKDRVSSSTPYKDAPSHKDDRLTNSSSLPNGRAILKGAVGSSRNNTSPASRPRGDSMNGARPTGPGSNRNTPTKLDTSKSSVPPLLSPLHLSFDDRNNEDKSQARQEKRRVRDDSRERNKSPTRHKKSDSTSEFKRQKSPVRIPPLLSPTLPPIVEAALQLRKKGSIESLEGKPLKGKDEKEKELPSKKKKPVADYHSDDDEPLSQKPQKPQKSLIVMIKVPKKLRKDVKRILALSSSTAARKELQAQNQERSAAPEEFIQPPPARKRPVAPVEAAASSETNAQKKPKASDIPNSSRLPAPTTPSKKGATSMSRVSSSNSLAQTPGDAVNATPSAPAPADRRVNGHDVHRSESSEARIMREKEAKFNALGRRLKHEADTAMRGGRRSPGVNGHTREPDLSKGYVISVESLLAFMAGFQAQNIYRGLCNKRSDPTGWNSLFPLLDFIQGQMKRQETHTRRFLPLYVVVLNLHSVAITELIRCHVVENSTLPQPDWFGLEKKRLKLLSQINEAASNIDTLTLRLNVPAHATLDDMTAASLRILRTWCHNEQVEWTPDAHLKEPVASRGS
ncbi:hypothetical protein M441DRAFT_45349 [Trichoderma asperellum CBS 433.97]|uniref:Uncharacterized protein n=1 Tax=Trichoderma asperellum (strain ATCC 204424 / CBS 433.97 / NBRC 101777) TaxID=1042311 RepID=A0A2T3ZF18_TRIA4|nr:hypothetical protein M441DRAFT_45349 [Trichoderma asperellum CBS 433.97]PTB43394.1 hypothetical protein M441DRAFT_45349 [Trichoderma asperellum CBS 433.97]